MIYEEQDFDLYALTHQIKNLGFSYDYVLERDIILDKVRIENEIG
jgi:hypothetical protein